MTKFFYRFESVENICGMYCYPDDEVLIYLGSIKSLGDWLSHCNCLVDFNDCASDEFLLRGVICVIVHEFVHAAVRLTGSRAGDHEWVVSQLVRGGVF
ncbi:MAG: hypothetical protein WC307_07005 [Candidatus Nanoarchaeia archaeon]|jgi:hypothetical protein